MPESATVGTASTSMTQNSRRNARRGLRGRVRACVSVARVPGVLRVRLMLRVVDLGHDSSSYTPRGYISTALPSRCTAMSHPLNTPLGRFGIVTSEDGPHGCIASIPAGGMINPLTGAPTIATLAMLVDHVGGIVNHHRRLPDEWTLTSELSLEVAPGRGGRHRGRTRCAGGGHGAAVRRQERRRVGAVRVHSSRHHTRHRHRAVLLHQDARPPGRVPRRSDGSDAARHTQRPDGGPHRRERWCGQGPDADCRTPS